MMTLSYPIPPYAQATARRALNRREVSPGVGIIMYPAITSVYIAGLPLEIGDDIPS